VRPGGRRVLDGLGAAIAVSPAAAAYHAGALGVPVTRFEVIPNGVDVSRFVAATADPAPGPDPEAGADPSQTRVSRHPSREEGDEEHLLFVGRLEPRKGLATLIRAFVALRAARPRLRLTVVGEGSERDHCRRLVPDAWRDDVHFVGRVDGAALVRHFAAADLYVSPALGGESFGIVLLEAMAAGRPVIASDIPGYRSVVTPGRDGVLVEPDDPDALAAAIGALLDDPARQEAMIAAGHVTAEAHDWSVVAERLRAVYARVLANA
jgi:phosphatidyl-myo-inositol alpha-mannosyltransferase